MKFLETITLVLIAIFAIIIPFCDFFGFLDSLTSFAPFKQKGYALTLIFLSLVTLYLIFAKLNIDKVTKIILNKLDIIINLRDLKKTADIVVLESGGELERYLAGRIDSATEEICDLTWKLKIVMGGNDRKKSHAQYEQAMFAASKRGVRYREIYIFNHTKRVEQLKTRAKGNVEAYECRYFQNNEHINKIPRLQFLILDNREVVFYASADNARLCAIKSQDLCNVLKPYFDEVWRAAIPIKIDKKTRKIDSAVLKEIDKNLPTI